MTFATLCSALAIAASVAQSRAALTPNARGMPMELARVTDICSNRVTNGGNCSVLLDGQC